MDKLIKFRISKVDDFKKTVDEHEFDSLVKKSIQAYISAMEEYKSRNTIITDTFYTLNIEAKIPVYNTYKEFTQWLKNEYLDLIQNDNRKISIVCIYDHDKYITIFLGEDFIKLFDTQVKKSSYNKKLIRAIKNVSTQYELQFESNHYHNNLVGVTQMMKDQENIITKSEETTSKKNTDTLEFTSGDIIRYSFSIEPRIIELFGKNNTKIGPVDLIWWSINN